MVGYGPDAAPEVAFVILTWNSERYVRDCVESVCALRGVVPLVVVVDNGSSDSTPRILDELEHEYPNVVTHRLARNFGTTTPRNIALRALPADIDYICVLDSDTRVNNEAIVGLCSALEADPSIGIAGPDMRDSAGRLQLSGRNLPTLREKILKAVPAKVAQEEGEAMEVPDTPVADGLQDVGYLLSACWMMKRSLIDEVGLLDERIFYAPEDADYCLRVRRAGFRIVRLHGVGIVHEYQRISKKKLVSKANLEHVKGLAYYFMKHGYLSDAEKAYRMVK